MNVCRECNSIVLYIRTYQDRMFGNCNNSLLGTLRGLGAEKLSTKLAAIQKVTSEDMSRCLEKYLQPLFDPKKTDLAIATSVTKCDIVKDAFVGWGYMMNVIPEDGIDAFFRTDG